MVNFTMDNREKLLADKLNKTKITLEKIRKVRKKSVERARLIDRVELEKLKKEYELDFEALAGKYEYLIRGELKRGLKSYIEKEKTSVDKFLNDYMEDVPEVFKKQFEWPESDYGLEKLIRYKEQKALHYSMDVKRTYLFCYMIEAINTFCRKKRNYYDSERVKRNAKSDTGYKQNAGAACRAYFHGKGCEDVWLSTVAIKYIETATISDEVIEKVRDYFLANNVKKEIIETFLDRLDGMKFTEMSRR